METNNQHPPRKPPAQHNILETFILSIFFLPMLVLAGNIGDDTILSTKDTAPPTLMYHPLNVTDPVTNISTIDPTAVFIPRHETINKPFIFKLEEDTGITFEYLNAADPAPSPDQLTEINSGLIVSTQKSFFYPVTKNKLKEVKYSNLLTHSKTSCDAR